MTPRELGRLAEPQAVSALKTVLRAKCPHLEVEVSRSTEWEDYYQRWDIRISFNGVCREIDLCISNKRFLSKVSFNHNNGYDIPVVVVDTRWSVEKTAKEVMDRFIHELPRRLVIELLAELAEAK